MYKRVVLSTKWEVFMQTSNGHPVKQELVRLCNDLVLVALQKGDLSPGREEFLDAESSTDELFRARIGDYAFSIAMLAAPGEDEHDPKVGQLTVEVALHRSATLALVRRTDRATWRVYARGTLSLPSGQPFGEFVHHTDYLGFTAKRMETECDDKQAFQLIKKIGYLLQHNLVPPR